MARRPPGTDLDALIDQYQHLTSHPRADQALHTIRKIGSMVKPIMRQRSWRVGTLAEFYPSETNLLGLNTNHGEKIQIRLRYASDPSLFLPLEEVVDTMLHELCHNVIGPHNAQFHALWDQLRDEMQALIRKGYTGEGFLGRGQSVGGRRMPLHEASRLARQAAEERKKAAERSRGSGQRLGGTGIVRGQDARQIIADAVERRIRIERGCGSGTAAGDRIARDDDNSKVTTTQAGPEDENEATMMQAYIDLIQEDEKEKFGGYYLPTTADNPAGSRGRSENTPPDAQDKAKSLVEQQREIEREILRQKRNDSKNENDVPSPNPPSTERVRQKKPSLRPPPDSETPPAIKQPPAPTFPPTPSQTELTTWTCEICTLINPLTYLSCDACGVERPDWISPALDPAAPAPNTSSGSSIPDQLRSTSNRRKQSSTNTTSSSSSTPAHKDYVNNQLKPRGNAYDNLAKFNAEAARKAATAPVGWTCTGCGNFMENEWWTCARCGGMKSSS